MCNELEIYEGHSIEFVLTRFSVDEDTGEETPEDFPDGTYTAFIYKDPGHVNVAFSLIVDSQENNEITLLKTKAGNTLKPDNYFFAIHNDIDGNTSTLVASAPVIVKPGRKP